MENSQNKLLIIYIISLEMDSLTLIMEVLLISALLIIINAANHVNGQYKVQLMVAMESLMNISVHFLILVLGVAVYISINLEETIINLNVDGYFKQLEIKFLSKINYKING
jgi:hypothetical protein